MRKAVWRLLGTQGGPCPRSLSGPRPTAGAALACRTPLSAASWASSYPGSVCGCWLRSTPDALESPGFLLGWANSKHSWVMEGGGPSAPIPSCRVWRLASQRLQLLLQQPLWVPSPPSPVVGPKWTLMPHFAGSGGPQPLLLVFLHPIH